jgi:hypothetical protein
MSRDELDARDEQDEVSQLGLSRQPEDVAAVVPSRPSGTT